MFSGIAGWKNARKELMLGLLEVWLSDDNTVVREKLRESVGVRLGPILVRIVAQGKAEGLFDVDDAPNAAGVLTGLIA